MSILTVTLHPAVDTVVHAPRLLVDDGTRTTIIMKYASGKGNNAARALHRLGIEVTATGFQGGTTGAWATAELEAEAIGTAFVTCREPTRESTILHEGETGHTYALYQPGQSVDVSEAEALETRFKQLIAAHTLCLLCGSGQTATLEPLYARLIEIARQLGKRCLLDSSGLALANSIRARPFLVRGNAAEIGAYLGRPLDRLEDQIQAVGELAALGIPIVGISSGAAGLVATDNFETWRGWLELNPIVNVVGCGDSQLAGIAKALDSNLTLPDLIRWGVACGTANTQTEGAGFIDPKLVAALVPRVSLQKF